MGLKAIGADRAFINGLFNGNRWLAAFSAANTEQAWGDYARIATALANYQASGATMSTPASSTSRTRRPPGPRSRIGACMTLPPPGTCCSITSSPPPWRRRRSGRRSASTPARSAGASPGSVTEMGSRACCSAGLLSGTRYLSIHTDDPGTAGDNAVANEDPIQVMQAQWTLDTTGANRRARNNAVLSFGASTADLPVAMWVALRDGRCGRCERALEGSVRHDAGRSRPGRHASVQCEPALDPDRHRRLGPGGNDHAGGAADPGARASRAGA